MADEIRSVRVAALARCKDADVKAAGTALKDAARPVIHTSSATSAIHLKYKLKTTAEEALKQAVRAVKLARTFVPEVRVLGRGCVAHGLRLPARRCSGPCTRRGREP